MAASRYTAKELADGETAPYRAFNGHTMVMPIRKARDGTPFTTSADALCADRCPACADGDPLPDW